MTAQGGRRRGGGEVRRKERYKRSRRVIEKWRGEKKQLFLHAARQQSLVTEGC